LLLVYGMTPEEPKPEPPERPKDSDPSEMTDFEKNTTSEELKKDQPGPGFGPRKPSSSIEREQEADSQSK
jgi:hypothetical protein